MLYLLALPSAMYYSFRCSTSLSTLDSVSPLNFRHYIILVTAGRAVTSYRLLVSWFQTLGMGGPGFPSSPLPLSSTVPGKAEICTSATCVCSGAAYSLRLGTGLQNRRLWYSWRHPDCSGANPAAGAAVCLLGHQLQLRECDHPEHPAEPAPIIEVWTCHAPLFTCSSASQAALP